MSTKQNITLEKLQELQDLIRQDGRPYAVLTNRDLIQEIDNQKSVVHDCIGYAKMIARDEDRDSIESLEGLYFAFHRYEQLTDELAARIKI
jgi:hypothetical protein